MQTFLPYPRFDQTAKCLDYRRLWKQILESSQILQTLLKGPYICSECKEPYPSDPCCGGMGKPVKTPWYNHPAVRMWKGHERCLALYAIWLSQEWQNRGYKSSLEQRINELAVQFPLETTEPPSWRGDEKFHASHRSNLLRKDPVWYGQFGWTEPTDLPYVWPTNA